MRAAVQRTAKHKLELEDRPIPRPGPGEVLIRVHACGVCHGDLMVQNGEFPFVQFPVVPGHEVAGVVESAGPGVQYPKPGTRVGVPWLFSACGHCKQCIPGDEILCADGQYAGMTRDGGYQEYMLAQAAYVIPLPDVLSFQDAAPLFCAGLSVYAGLVHAGFKPGHKVAVVGLGGLGNLAILFAKAMGGSVAVVSSTREKESAARQLGAEKFIHQGSEPVGDSLSAWDGGADIILQVAPSADSANAAFPGLAPDGTMVLLAPTPIAVDPFTLILRRQRIMGLSSGSRKELRETLHIAATHNIRPQSKSFPLASANAALEELKNSRPPGRLVLTMDAG